MADFEPSGTTREFHGDSADVLGALGDILASASFANADRLKNFLDYVVTEAVNGRSDAIKGKTIALDVYDRNAATDGDPENVVRVDARRLRRRLAEYYASEGKNARVRIHIDSGGYAPRFEWVEAGAPAAPVLTNDRKQAPGLRRLIPSRPHIVIAGLATGFAVMFIAGYLLLFAPRNSGPAVFPDSRAMERQALLEKSPAALQAVTMAEQAREMMLPLFDITRQKLSLGFFQQAISLDPSYSGGYAGAAQVFGTLAVLTPPGPEKSALQKQSRAMAQKAVELNPTNAWSQSAASWSSYANNEYDEAVRLSARAYALAPNNLQILEIYGAVALWNGEFELAARTLEEAAMNPPADSRSGAGNVFAAAKYFLGDYEAALKALRITAESGGPISPAATGIQVAASQALGDHEMAKRYARNMQKTWSNVPIDQIYRQLFRYSEHAEEIIRHLKEAGWQYDPEKSPQ